MSNQNLALLNSFNQRKAIACMIVLTITAFGSGRLQAQTLTNGFKQTGTIVAGTTNTYTFDATSGDTIVLRMGAASYNPRIEVLNPSSTPVGYEANGSSGIRDIDLDIRATNSGTFTVRVSSLTAGGNGAYILTLAKSPGTFTVAPGDEGGPLTNGYKHTGFIDVGDLDVWTFTANSGDGIVLRMGLTNINPWIRLYGPNGTLIGQGFNGSSGIRDADLQLRATNSGAFTVVASSLYENGTGGYLLTLAKTPGAVEVSPGDQGGALTNGYKHTGFIDVGDLDVWTFTANSGDGIVLRMGLTNINPWIRLYGPDGTLIGQGFNGSSGIRDADLQLRATNSGAFTVVASSLYENGTGGYLLTLAKTPGAVAVSPGDQGGALTNAYQHSGSTEIGDVDVWTFSANAGDSVVLRMGAVGYNPWIRLFGPNGVMVRQAADGSSGIRDADLQLQVTNSGTFTVVVGSWLLNGIGTYMLSLAHIPEAVTLAPGDQGGAMTNAFQHSGNIEIGDVDVWTFSANAGDSIVLRMGATGYNPWIRLFGPNGTMVKQEVDGSSGVRDADLQFQATNSGVFTVVVGSYYNNGNGAYILSLAHVPDAITLSPGEHGGAMTNGYQHSGHIEIGDVDVWTFSANTGDAIVLRMGSVGYNPWIRLFGPNGTMVRQAVDGSSNIRDVDLQYQATNSGNFTVVVGSYYYNGNGAYILSLAHVPDAVTVSSGDQGGAMTNGYLHTGFLEIGDMDVYSFSANIGDNLALRMGTSGTTNAPNPYIRLFSPTGVLVGQGYDGAANIQDGELRIQATNAGTFTVVASFLYLNGTGNYILTLGRSPGAATFAAGDEGGWITTVQSTGTIDLGDMDVWNFQACRGSFLILTCEELTGGTSFSPRMRLFSPTGVLLQTSVNATLAVINYTTTNFGIFNLIVDGGALNHAGTYRLTAHGFAGNGLWICSPLISGTNVSLSAIGGAAGSNGVLSTTTNLTLPITWTPVLTNVFDQLGHFTSTNVANSTERQRYFRLQQQ
jgi:trimeric autotransporter adhesin